MEQMGLFRRYVEIADWAWRAVANWTPFARDTLGKQLVRAAYGVGANLVEGDGRRTDRDALHFFVIARASARETRYWLERAATRNLIKKDEADAQIQALVTATQLLNRLIAHRRRPFTSDRISEDLAFYDADDPFAPPPDFDVPDYSSP
jgi:four helix bundle protein